MLAAGLEFGARGRRKPGPGRSGTAAGTDPANTGINRIGNSALPDPHLAASLGRGAGGAVSAGAAVAPQGRAGSEHEGRAPRLPPPLRAPPPPGPAQPSARSSSLRRVTTRRLLPPPKAPSPGPIPRSRAVSSQPFPSERCRKGGRGQRCLGLQLPACSAPPPPRHATLLTAGSNGAWGRGTPPSSAWFAPHAYNDGGGGGKAAVPRWRRELEPVGVWG